MRGVLEWLRLGVGGAWARRWSEGNGMVMAEPPFIVDRNDIKHLPNCQLESGGSMFFLMGD
jgi:hypothetical protein